MGPGGGLGSSSGTMGSSSILNLPVLGQENVLQPTNRGLKGIDSTKQLFRGEENKSSSFEMNSAISGATNVMGGAMSMPHKNPSYFSRSGTNGSGQVDPMSPV